jgi:serine O-acetyltransferase
MFENIRQDFRANGGRIGAQGFWALVICRFGRWRCRVRPSWLRKVFSLFYKILFKLIQILTEIELPCEAMIGRQLTIDHCGGIIVSGYARFGDHCRIRNDVVVGLRSPDRPGVPLIGNNVDIGAGAKLLGPIRIGDNVVIGANAVVLCDVPDNCSAVGVPAIVRSREPLAARLALGRPVAAAVDERRMGRHALGWLRRVHVGPQHQFPVAARQPREQRRRREIADAAYLAANESEPSRLGIEAHRDFAARNVIAT